MLAVSRDGGWLSRLERLVHGDGWAFEARSVVPSIPGPSPDQTVIVIDRGLAGASPAKAVASMRVLYPGAAVALAFNDGEADHDAVAAAVSCGADELLIKSWTDAALAPKLAALRDRALSAQERLSADGGLRAERRSHRAYVKSGKVWKELTLDAGGFALLWRLLSSENRDVSREDLAKTLAEAAGRELDTASVSRRVAALKKALSPWKGAIERARGGLFRLVSEKP